MQARTTNFDKLWNKYPTALLSAGEESVGLPKGQVGTSEVNHMTIGAGRVILQELLRINKSIDSKEINKNKNLLKTFEHVKKNRSRLHLMGLLSDGGVHSHIDHYLKMLELAKSHHIKKTILHIFTDGRDTSPQSGLSFVQRLEEKINELGYGVIASVSGRYYAMDRDNNWERTDLFYDAIVNGKGKKYKSAEDVVELSYKKGINDEFIHPALLESKHELTVRDKDAIIFTNFRSDRAKQITQKFITSEFKNLQFTSMTQYSEGLRTDVLFEPEKINSTLGEVISNENLKQLRIAETEKFNHVTYFFNCKRDYPFEAEDRILLDSNSHVKTHDELPEMRAYDITTEILEEMQKGDHDFVLVNYANPDIVGHSAKLADTIKAVEVVDECIGKIYEKAIKTGHTLIITADHGNAEELIDRETGEQKTSHTLNPVPLILIDKDFKSINKETGELIDIAPTILDLFQIPTPKKMKGESLIG